uniref:Uncharacterized protein n=1 Tax=Arundo donax TaxID=35708 RepID=A0A0A9DK13_ARUDO
MRWSPTSLRRRAPAKSRHGRV